MGAYFELLSGFLIHMGRAVDRKPFDMRRKRNGSGHSPAGPFYGLNNLAHRLVQNAVVIGSQSNSDFLVNTSLK